jgi:predicted Zn-dependent protease
MTARALLALAVLSFASVDAAARPGSASRAAGKSIRQPGAKAAKPAAKTTLGAVRRAAIATVRPPRAAKPATRPPRARLPRGAQRKAIGALIAKGFGPRASPIEVFVGGVLETAFRVTSTARSSVNRFLQREQLIALSPAQEIQIGNQHGAEFVRTNGGLYRDPVIARYVESVGQRVVQRSGLASSGYPFRFRVVASESPNAIALPGGLIFVTVGLLRQLPSEAALAFVLAHEGGHVVGRHGAENLVQGQLREGVLVAGVQAGGSPLVLTAPLRRQMLANSRDQEFEADGIGAKGMIAAGYDRAGLDHFAKVLDLFETATPEVELDHPTKTSRVGHLLKNVMPTVPFVPGDVGVAPYLANVSARLPRPVSARGLR